MSPHTPYRLTGEFIKSQLFLHFENQLCAELVQDEDWPIWRVKADRVRLLGVPTEHTDLKPVDLRNDFPF
jgi:hypothetical protein